MPNVSKGILIMVGLVTASTIILKHWKSSMPLNLKEWTDAMVETASYESMLGKIKDCRGDKEDGENSWDFLWTGIGLSFIS